MNKESHIMIGKILCERLRHDYGICLNKEAFLLGNVLPDFGINFLIKPHLFRNYRHQIKKRIQRLLNAQHSSAMIGKSCSVQLGVICHYYADFFCYVHNGGYSGDVASHVKYEKELCRYLSGMLPFSKEMTSVLFIPDEIDADTIFERLLSTYAAYLDAEPSPHNDVTVSIEACMEALVLITSISEQANDYSGAAVLKA